MESRAGLWYCNGMKTTIDRGGRLVIPKPLREQAGLRPGDELTIECEDGLIRLVPPSPKGCLVQKRSVLVWRPESGAGTADVSKLIEEERERRLGEVAGRAGF